MAEDSRVDGAPRSAVVVGAGIVGLSTAWFLQEHGVRVTVVDHRGVAGGASWGNAGYLSPGLAIPLNEPAVLRYGLRALADRTAPLSVPAAPDPGLWAFLARFAAHCTWGGWERAARANLPLNTGSLAAFDVLTSGGVDAPTFEAPITALFSSPREATGLLGELRRMRAAGQEVPHTAVPGAAVPGLVPQASARIGAGVRLERQRFLDPGGFVRALADSVLARGGTVREDVEVTDVRGDAHGVTLRAVAGGADERLSAETAVLATGAWLDRLARTGGVRVPVRAGRGYSFTVPTEAPVPGPVYLPGVRVACTPYRGGLRVAGTMEFRGPDDAPDRERIDAIVASARPLLDGVRWDERTDEWVGPRPVTPDGRPLIGATTVPGVHVAGGHGMWGFTQGPVTGRLLAEQIVTGKQPEELRHVDPLR